MLGIGVTELVNFLMEQAAAANASSDSMQMSVSKTLRWISDMPFSPPSSSLLPVFLPDICLPEKQ